MKLAKIVKRNVQPVHTHDCEHCRFLGRLGTEDLYVCFVRTVHGKPCFIRRFGSSGPEYGSLGDFAPEGSAYSLAQAILARQLPPNAYRVAG